MSLNFDLHIHSKYSLDSYLEPGKIIKIAKRKNLDGISITDHNTIKGGKIAQKIADDRIIIIIGSEIMTDKGEIIGLFLNEDIDSRIFDEVIDSIKDQGGLSVLPHPYRNNNQPEKLVERIDFIEGLNARTDANLNIKAQLLACRIKKPLLAGSDAHTGMEIGRVRTMIDKINYDDRTFLARNNIVLEGKESLKLVRLLSIGLGKFIKRYNEIF